MSVPDESGGAWRHPGSSPERGRGRRRQSHGSERETTGDGAAAGGAESLQTLQRLGGHLLSGYLLILEEKKLKPN